MDGLLIAFRFAHFSAAMLLFGLTAFTSVVAPRALADRYAAVTRWVDAALALALVATAFGWFALEVGEAGNGWADATNPAMWGALANGTEFGQVWIWHLAISVVLFAAIALPRDVRGVALVIGSTTLLASLGLVGHAAMQQGAVGWEHRIGHALHLLGAGFWVGALLPLLVCLLALRHPDGRTDATTALHRFSGLGHVAVALTLLTGILNTSLTLGQWPVDFRSPYQALLALKIALVAVMLSIALINRYVLTPRLAVRGLVIGTSIELGLGVVVIALVSAFATYDPV